MGWSTAKTRSVAPAKPVGTNSIVHHSQSPWRSDPIHSPRLFGKGLIFWSDPLGSKNTLRSPTTTRGMIFWLFGINFGVSKLIQWSLYTRSQNTDHAVITSVFFQLLLCDPGSGSDVGWTWASGRPDIRWPPRGIHHFKERWTLRLFNKLSGIKSHSKIRKIAIPCASEDCPCFKKHRK